MPLTTLAALVFEYGLVALGWLLIWRLQFSSTARKSRATMPDPLPHWPVDSASFAFAGLCVMLGWLASSIALGQVLRLFPAIKADDILLTILNGTFSQLGLFSGMLAGAYYIRQTAQRQPLNDPPVTAKATPAVITGKANLVLAALATFAITIAVVYPVQWLWEQLLLALHLPTTKQEVVEIFFRSSSPGRVAALAAMAVLLAPVTEELVFRAGLFRFLRGRTPRWIALVLPALIFASLHVDYKTLDGLISLAPLTAFGFIFALAYERTGRIAVVMLAHALFNLHTVVFLLLGLGN